MQFSIFITLAISFTFITSVLGEGYSCFFEDSEPLVAAGLTENNTLLYSYYEFDVENNVFIKLNEYGFQSQEDYCAAKNDPIAHPNEDLIAKCNDSRQICIHVEGECLSTGTADCSSQALCEAVLRGEEAQCLGGDCLTTPSNNDFLYEQYCNVDNTTTTSTDLPTETSTDMSTETSTETTTDTLTDMPTETSTDIPTETSTEISTDVPTDTVTETIIETVTEVINAVDTDTVTLIQTENLPLPTDTTRNVVKIEYTQINGVCKNKVVYLA